MKLSVHRYHYKYKCVFLTAYGGTLKVRRLRFSVLFSKLLFMENKNLNPFLKPGYAFCSLKHSRTHKAARLLHLLS